MNELMDVYNWSNREIPKKIHVKLRHQPSQNFGGRDDQFGSHEMPTIDIAYDWLAKEPKSKKVFTLLKPITTLEVQQSYEIAQLKDDVLFHKTSLINYQNRVAEYTADYNNLKDDYLNSQGKVKELESKLELFEGLEQNHLWLMQQHLNLKKELGK